MSKLIHQTGIIMCITFILIGGMWISCGQGGAKMGGRAVFRMNLDAGLQSLDPAFASSRSPIWMTAQLFNGLVTLDSVLRPQPALAKRWEISEQGRVYTFFLRDSVFFHESEAFGGTRTRKLTAQDVVYSFTRLCDPGVASKGAWIFAGKVAGLDAFREGETDTISGFEAVDDTTFVIRLIRPFPPMLGLLAMPYGYVIPKEAIDYYGEDWGQHPVGTGPFQLYRWRMDQRLILHRNPHYFEKENGERLPYLDAVSVQFIPSRLTAFIEFRQGNLDFIGDLDASYRDEVLDRAGNIHPVYADRYTFLLAPQLNTEYLGILVDSSVSFVPGHPLADVRVRQALNYAIDRQQLVRYLLNGMGYPAHSGFVPQGMPGYDSVAVPGYRYDPARAAELLTAAGFSGGKGLPELVLHSTDKYAAISEFIQKSFENVGVKLRIDNMQGSALRREVYGVKLNFWRASWIADYPDGENYLSLFYSPNHSPDGPNTTHFRSKVFDSLYVKALAQPVDTLRFKDYQEMDRLMLQQAPIIPLYYDRSFRMLQPGITGLGSNAMNHLYLKRVRM